ncbi:MAG: SIR2 family protein [Dechloromonas sp.]|nr:SIR2 family protein [Dechloromonas sp.]
MTHTTFSRMADAAQYEDHDSLLDFLSTQLLHGRLALILGAGASFGFGLPSWDKLTDEVCKAAGIPKPSGSNEAVLEKILIEHCARDEIKFAALVQKALYSNYDSSIDTLSSNKLLSAVAAIAMASRRGSVSKIVSYNFDDLLEVYLSYLGFDTNSIAVLPAWHNTVDVTVYHPHGLLPSKSGKAIPRPIILTQAHFDDVVGDSKDAWRATVLDVMSSSTCLFIGLSGDDRNLTSCLAATYKQHASKAQHHLYWGVRFTNFAGDPNNDTWKHRGVFNIVLNDYNELPSWLLRICQLAADKRLAARES